MRPPCEQIVRYVLPAFRSLVARELVERHRFSQVAAAKKLGTTQAAISHYLHLKRGKETVKELESTPLVQSAASEIAQNIATGEFSVMDAMLAFCELCMTLRKQNTLNIFHGGGFQATRR